MVVCPRNIVNHAYSVTSAKPHYLMFAYLIVLCQKKKDFAKLWCMTLSKDEIYYFTYRIGHELAFPDCATELLERSLAGISVLNKFDAFQRFRHSPHLFLYTMPLSRLHNNRFVQIIKWIDQSKNRIDIQRPLWCVQCTVIGICMVVKVCNWINTFSVN